MDIDVGLVLELEARKRGDAGVGEAELHPLALPRGVKTRGVQLALVEVFVAGRDAATHVLRIPQGRADELVDVLVARVAAHVERQGLAGLRKAAYGGLVGHAAHDHALDGRGVGVQRVDLDVVAEGVGLVAEVGLGVTARRCGVPAREAVVGGGNRVPALADRPLDSRSGRRADHAIAPARCQIPGRQCRPARGHPEIEGPVLFAAQVGAPGRLAVAAVVQGAAGHAAGGVPAGDHLGADGVDVRTRPGHAHGRLRRDTPVQGRVGLDAPALRRLDDLHHRHAVVVDLLEHLGSGAGAQVPVAELGELPAGHTVGGLAVGVHEEGVGRALVVDGQHGAAGVALGVAALVVDEVQVHAVVVVAHAHRPVVGFRAGVGVRRDRRPQRIARGVQHGVAVARGQGHVVHQRLGDTGKSQGLRRTGACAAHHGGTARQHGQTGQAQAPAQQRPTAGLGQRLLQDVLEVRVVGFVADGIEFGGMGGHVCTRELTTVPSRPPKCESLLTSPRQRLDMCRPPWSGRTEASTRCALSSKVGPGFRPCPKGRRSTGL